MTNVLIDYDGLLIGLSFALAPLGAWVRLFTSAYVRNERGEIRGTWLVLSAIIVAGCMMWAAHYVGTLAYQPDVGMTFGIRLTFLSFVMAISFATVAILVVTRHSDSAAILVIGAATMTMVVVALHYGAWRRCVRQPSWSIPRCWCRSRSCSHSSLRWAGSIPCRAYAVPPVAHRCR